jgi:hypothetical protein
MRPDSPAGPPLAASPPAPPASAPTRAARGTAALLAAILLVALGFRFVGHDWDEGLRLNVDEVLVAKTTTQLGVPPPAGLAALLDPQASPLNPRRGGAFWVYGALPLYLVKLTAAGLAALTGDPTWTAYDGVVSAGRGLVAVLDTLVALLVFGVGRALWGRGVGLVAAALYACAILPIETSHFFIVDPFAAAFMTAALACAALHWTRGGARWALLGGFAVGLALACKVSAAPGLVLPLAAVALRA